MYRKTLIALACAVISAPAFAQISTYAPDSSFQSTLPECSHQLTEGKYHQEPCSNLDPFPHPSQSQPPDEPLTGLQHGWKPNPQEPPSTLDTLGGELKNNCHPTYRNGVPGWECPW